MKAAEFDIKRAYNEIKMFRELASSAENAEGIIGMDYEIKGVLNNKMEPIMPSLEGGGTRITSYNVCYTKLLRSWDFE